VETAINQRKKRRNLKRRKNDMINYTSDLLMILGVIGLTFGAGVWYGTNICGRYQHTEEGSRAQTRATTKNKLKEIK